MSPAHASLPVARLADLLLCVHCGRPDPRCGTRLENGRITITTCAMLSGSNGVCFAYPTRPPLELRP